MGTVSGEAALSFSFLSAQLLKDEFLLLQEQIPLREDLTSPGANSFL